MTAADPTSLQELLAVQELDRKLDALRHQRATLPERTRLVALAGERAALLEKRAEIDSQRHDLGRGQKRLEDEVALIDARIEQETGRLYGGNAGGVKELQALQEEIEGLGRRKALVEDQIIEIMEQIEPVDAALERLRVEERAIDESEQDVSEALGAAEADIDELVATVDAQRTERTAGVSPELLAIYDRLRAEPGRVAVARLVGFTCHGCHLDLAAMEVDRLKKLPQDELVHCDECGCILVR